MRVWMDMQPLIWLVLTALAVVALIWVFSQWHDDNHDS
jgi:hypothetical protein